MNFQECKNIVSCIRQHEYEWNKNTMNDLSIQYSNVNNHFQNKQNIKIYNNTNIQHTNNVNKQTEEEKWFSLQSLDKNTHSSPKDTWFWFFYIMYYNIEKYIFFKNKQQIEYEEKMNIVKYMETTCPTLTKPKIHEIKSKCSLHYKELINEIACQSLTMLHVLIGLCIIYEIPVIFIKGKTYLKITNSVKYYIIHIDKCKMKYEKESENMLKDKYIEINSLDKPLLAHSHYKAKELQEYAVILGLQDKMYTLHPKTQKQKMKTKQELYKLIQEHII